MTPNKDQIDEAILKAWSERYGNITQDILPPITPLYREAFEEGVAFALGNLELKKDI